MHKSLDCPRFKSLEELQAYLKALPEYDSWDTGSAKSVDNLWRELELGESMIAQDGSRKVRVVVGELRSSPASELRLVELEQTLADGRKRVRSTRPMAEKMIGNEEPRTALNRGLFEELGLTTDDFSLLTTEPLTSTTSRLSSSYPGMLSYYQRFIFQVITSALPHEDFTITEPDGIRSATWGWRKIASPE